MAKRYSQRQAELAVTDEGLYNRRYSTDGTKSQLGPFESGSVGTTYTLFTPTQTGTYTFVFSFPGQTLEAPPGSNPMGMAYVGDYFEPSTSSPLTLTVTEKKVEDWKEPAIPTGYWTRPINGQNRDWSSLASNWLGGSWLVGNFQPAGQAPNTAHIIWAATEQPGVSANPGASLTHNGHTLQHR